MNRVELTGYIANEIELRHTPQGVAVVTFTLAVKRPKVKEDITDFITIVVWRGAAEFVSKYFKKGSGIEVEGVLTIRKWTDKNGNNRYSTEVIADEVGFGKNTNNAQRDEQNNYDSNAAANDFKEIKEDLVDELPF